MSWDRLQLSAWQIATLAALAVASYLFVTGRVPRCDAHQDGAHCIATRP